MSIHYMVLGFVPMAFRFEGSIGLGKHMDTCFLFTGSSPPAPGWPQYEHNLMTLGTSLPKYETTKNFVIDCFAFHSAFSSSTGYNGDPTFL